MGKVTAKEAIKAIKTGYRIFIGAGCGEPQTLIEALVADRDRLENVEILGATHMGECPYAATGMEKYFRLVSFVPTLKIRDALRERRADYIPCHTSEVPRLFNEGYLPIDVALVQLSPPDTNGYCSFGISVDITKLAAESAKIIIGEINDKMPMTCGDSLIHLSRIHHFIESSVPLLTLERPKIGEIENSIGELVGSLIPDGATLQIGLGSIPEGVCRYLKEKKNLGIHTGLLSDSIMEAIKSGVITNSEKTIDSGKSVTGQIMGSNELYKFVNRNPLIEMRTVTYTHNPLTFSKIRNLVSINSAVEVDLTGQINAEVVEGEQVGGVGGHMDFTKGASISPGGKSIIVLQSSAKKGSKSRIVPNFKIGAVTTTRSDVQYVVTEFGIADLRGKNLAQRAKAIASIAHPNFREELMHIA